MGISFETLKAKIKTSPETLRKILAIMFKKKLYQLLVTVQVIYQLTKLRLFSLSSVISCYRICGISKEAVLS